MREFLEIARVIHTIRALDSKTIRALPRRIVPPTPDTPGEPLPLTWENKGAQNQPWQSTMILSIAFCKILWPEESGAKSFRGKACKSKREAEESAAHEFWKDSNVQKTAADLPPAKRKTDKFYAQKAHRERQEAQKKDGPRLKRFRHSAPTSLKRLKQSAPRETGGAGQTKRN